MIRLKYLSGRSAALLLAVALAACGRQPQIARTAPDGTEVAAPLPNSLGALWHVSADGKGIELARPAGKPFLTLHCVIAAGAKPRLAVIRHAQSEPGAKALFAVLGNGVISRMKLDAKLAREGWLWEGVYAADAPELDVFTGQREIEATLPGAGMLKIGGSALPHEFIQWCRRNGAKLPVDDGAGISPPSRDRSGSRV
ncbi:MAG: hypothetical protein P0Y56_05360 [Candidatus Andeanibacterium colombiense]|uniref:Uncharacterized protein n=1 Tax=Candidatus Andeanibacterium colombiense TaxID=3121345 RepID=A0AAJ5XAP9_9SPHN|nr:MAG: hypothetical protein P0Y56_05360 [Sphingomonadaceae bacterium]